MTASEDYPPLPYAGWQTHWPTLSAEEKDAYRAAAKPAPSWWLAANRDLADRTPRTGHSAEDYTEAELAEIRRSVSIVDRATELWLRPIAKPYAVMSATMDKPLGELTMPDLLSWVYCLTYASATGLVAGSIVFRILTVILGPRR